MNQLQISFFRHGETKPNALGLCVGRTNVLISPKGRQMLQELKDHYEYPTVEKVFSSPAIRCLETADILFPDMTPEIIDNLWEMDYGDLDNHTVPEFIECLGEKWNRRDPSATFPGGESYLEASFRIRNAITKIITSCIENGLTNIAVVAHADILYTLMLNCLDTEEDFYHFILCPNGMGYSVTLDPEAWFTDQRFQFVRFLPEGAKRPKPEDSPYFK